MRIQKMKFFMGILVILATIMLIFVPPTIGQENKTEASEENKTEVTTVVTEVGEENKTNTEDKTNTSDRSEVSTTSSPSGGNVLLRRTFINFPIRTTESCPEGQRKDSRGTCRKLI